MALTLEWRRRIDSWMRALQHVFYPEPKTVEMAGLVTQEQLTVEEAMGRDFAPMPPGTRWGAMWEYAWFRGSVVAPDAADGQRLVFDFGSGGTEALIFVNGRAAGTHAPPRPPLTLAAKARAGQEFSLLVEAYAGNGETRFTGPVPHGQMSLPEPPETQQEVQPSTVGIWQEPAYQLWLDATTLLDLRDNLDPHSLRVAEIDRALCDFTLVVDLELPREQMLETIRAGRECLGPLLECVNGSTAPTMFAFGHGHLDVAWRWPLAETDRKAARTLANQLALAEEYDSYKFLHSQPYVFDVVRRLYPALYERVREAVARGSIIAEGGMWVEADTNITGGESLIRQFLHGKRFFREQFGVESEMLWLPDVFGYCGALPQILRSCGIRYFTTHKLLWLYKGGQPFPYNTFTWEGIDGSEVLTHVYLNYGSHTRPSEVIERWRELSQKDRCAGRLMPFGFGDGGGGPIRDHVEFAMRQENLEGSPRVRSASPVEFFKDIEQRGAVEPRYVGELYLQYHRGTYTSQAGTKKGNRKSEVALREAEMWSAAASAMADLAFPAERMEQAWKQVLLNQFHDILPGSSIARVHAEAVAGYDRSTATADEVSSSARERLVGSGDGLTVFNSLSWDRTSTVALPGGWAGAKDASGNDVPVQEIDGRVEAEVRVPACGWTSLASSASPAACGRANLIAADDTLENDLLRLTFDQFGRIVSFFDKAASQELTAAPCNEFRMYKDVSGSCDAWDIDRMYPQTPVELNQPATIEVVAAGMLRTTLRIARPLHDSTMTQEVTLRAGSRRVEFRTVIDWQERHKLLKVAFPVRYHADEALHEIQFGHLHRPTHYSQPFDADRYEVCNHKWSALVEPGRGFAVLNDCKYGLNVLGNSINLTLLKAAQAPDPMADRGRQEFTYACCFWNGTFFDSDIVRQGYELNCPVRTSAGAAAETSLFSLDAANVVIETVKPAEDGSGDCIVRLYEAKRTATQCTLTTSLPVRSATATDMLENPESDLTFRDGTIGLDFRPFEIKTLLLRF